MGTSAINLISLTTEKSYYYQLGFIGTHPGPLELRDDVIFNGLPYYSIDGSTGGGKYGRDSILQQISGNNIGTAQVDEFLCIPQGYIIPSNIKTRGQYTTRSLQRVASFFRRCEKYGGSETTYDKQQLDAENWYIDLDIGLADDFNNAMSN